MLTKEYKCRYEGNGPGNWTTIEVSAFDSLSPEHAVEVFAEEYGAKYFSVVEVFRHGKYRVYIDWEPVFDIKKID